jgi:hypothetical protein
MRATTAAADDAGMLTAFAATLGLVRAVASWHLFIAMRAMARKGREFPQSEHPPRQVLPAVQALWRRPSLKQLLKLAHMFTFSHIVGSF